MFWRLKKLTFLALSLGSTVLVILFAVPTHAQVSMSPLMVVMNVQNGQGQQLVTVRNRTDQPYRARVYTEPFTYTSNGLEPLQRSPVDLTPYIVFSPRELELKPGAERNVRLVVKVPPNLNNTELRSVLFVQDLKEVALSDPNAKAQTAVVSRIGMPIYARIGNVEPNLSALTATYDDGRDRISIRVKNSGAGSTRAWINWTLEGKGKVVEGKAAPSSIVGESERDIYIENDPLIKSLQPGKYQLKGSLDTERENSQKTFPFSLTLEVPAPKQ